MLIEHLLKYFVKYCLANKQNLKITKKKEVRF